MTAALLDRPPKTGVTAYELIRLFAGCDLCDGFPTVPLARRIIEATHPSSFGELRRLVYGDWPPLEIPGAGAECLQLAWTLSRMRGRA